MMDEQEYKKFLGDIEKRLSIFVAKGRAFSMSRFHDSCRSFCKQEDAYWEAFEKALKEAEEDPRLQEYNEGEPPAKGYEWTNCSEIISTPLSGFYSRPLPFSPDSWISYYYGWSYPGGDKPPREPNHQETTMCEYVVLGLIHDEVKRVAKLRRLCNIDNETWRMGTWDRLRLPNWAAYEEGEIIKERLNDALLSVEAEHKNGPVIFVDMKRFNKGTGSLVLLRDLIADTARDGVTLGEEKYGKKQPQSLRDMLKNNGYENIAKKVKLKNGIVKLDIPLEQITTEAPKTAKK